MKFSFSSYVNSNLPKPAIALISASELTNKIPIEQIHNAQMLLDCHNINRINYWPTAVNGWQHSLRERFQPLKHLLGKLTLGTQCAPSVALK